METIEPQGNEDHRVQWHDQAHSYTTRFVSPRDAYDFWLNLPRGIRAKLYQYGKLTGEGTGLESGD